MLVGQLAAAPPGGQRAEEHVPAVERVHPDPVAQQRAAAAPPGRVDREHRHPQLVLLVGAQPADQLVGQRRLARAAGAGDAEHGHRPAGRGLDQGRAGRRRGRRPACRQVIARASARRSPASTASAGAGSAARSTSQSRISSLIMPGRPRRWPSSGEKIRTPASASRLISSGTMTPPPPPKTFTWPGAGLGQLLGQVLEVLDVAALVGADRHPLRVLLEHRVDHLADRAVVAQVDHLSPLGLQDPPHDVDRGVVPVEQRGRGDEAHRMRRNVQVGAGAGSGHGNPPPDRPRETRSLDDQYLDVKINIGYGRSDGGKCCRAEAASPAGRRSWPGDTVSTRGRCPIPSIRSPRRTGSGASAGRSRPTTWPPSPRSCGSSSCCSAGSRTRSSRTA